MKIQNKEHRHFTRISFTVKTTLINSNTKQQWQSNLHDVSLKGALVDRPEDWSGEIGDEFQLNIYLTELEHILMMVKLVHIEKTCIGFSCEHIDLDSVTHLRRLVELNLGDETILEREFAELLETKLNN